jgi:coatomer protein complex subunit gamma
LDDVDDEVRDRAAMYLKVVNEEPLADAFVREGAFRRDRGDTPPPPRD